MYPTTVLDARWLHKGGTGSFTRSLLAGLHDRAPEGWAIWGPADGAPFVWPGARLERCDVDPAGWFGQRSALRVPRADIVLHPHQTRPLHRWPAASCVLDLIQLEHPSPVLRAAFAARLALTVRAAEVVFTISDEVRDQLVDRYRLEPSAVTVLRLPVDDEAAGRVEGRRAAAEPLRQLLAVGRFARHKNQQGLIEAFARTRFAAAGGQLVLVGGQAEELGLSAGNPPRGVRVAGLVPAAELEALMASSLALVQPSFREGLGLPVLEAVLAGVPVISSPVPAVTEMGPQGLPTFDPRSPADMAIVIDRTVELIDAGRYWDEVDRDRWVRDRPTPASLADQVLGRLR